MQSILIYVFNFIIILLFLGFVYLTIKSIYIDLINLIKNYKKAGYTIEELRDAGYTIEELRDAGYTAKELKNAGYTAKDLKDISFNI